MLHFHKWKLEGTNCFKDISGFGYVGPVTRFLYLCSVCKKPKIIKRTGDWTKEVSL